MSSRLQAIARRFHIMEGRRDAVKARVENTQQQLRELGTQLEQARQGQLIVQAVAMQTQQELQYRVSSLVTAALSHTFPNPYEFKVEFEIKRGKTECSLLFTRQGEQVSPMDGAGGGAVDVAAFALRLVLWSIQQPRNRPLIVLDEPFRFLNDPTRQLHAAAAAMLKEVCIKLGLQVLCVTQLPELHEVADRCFYVSMEPGGKVSRVVTGNQEPAKKRRAGRAKKKRDN